MSHQHILNDEHQFNSHVDYSHNSMNSNHFQQNNNQHKSLSNGHRSHSGFFGMTSANEFGNRSGYFVTNDDNNNQYGSNRDSNSNFFDNNNNSNNTTRFSNQSINNQNSKQYDFGTIIPNVMHQSLSGEFQPLQAFQSDFQSRSYNVNKHSNSSHDTSYNNHSRESINQPLVSMNDINSVEKPTKSQKKKASLSQQTSNTTLISNSNEDPEILVLLEEDQSTFFQKCRALDEEQRAMFPERYMKELSSFNGISSHSLLDQFHPDQQLGYKQNKQRGSKRERVIKAHTPRPSNSFILYRKAKHAEIMSAWTNEKHLNNNYISKLVAKWWRNETPLVKQYWSKRADDEKILHKEKYPDYKYRPRKSLMKTASQQNYDDEVVVEECVEKNVVIQTPSPMYKQSISQNFNQSYIAPYGSYSYPIAPNPYPVQQSQYQQRFQNFNYGGFQQM